MSLDVISSGSVLLYFHLSELWYSSVILYPSAACVANVMVLLKKALVVFNLPYSNVNKTVRCRISFCALQNQNMVIDHNLRRAHAACKITLIEQVSLDGRRYYEIFFVETNKSFLLLFQKIIIIIICKLLPKFYKLIFLITLAWEQSYNVTKFIVAVC